MDAHPLLDGRNTNLAETAYTPLQAAPDAAPVRLIVRPVKPTPGYQLARFVNYSYHGLIPDREGGTLELEADHRRHAGRPCIFRNPGLGQRSSAAPSPGCKRFHPRPNGARLRLTRQPTQRPSTLAPARSASVPCCVLYHQPVPRDDCIPPSTPKVATAGRSRPTALLGRRSDHRARSPQPLRCRITLIRWIRA